ncbi:transcriptional repressor [Desulforudis sp. DRI-14]
MFGWGFPPGVPGSGEQSVEGFYQIRSRLDFPDQIPHRHHQPSSGLIPIIARRNDDRLSVLDEENSELWAEHVYEAVKKVFPSISFNTVYKTVQAFEEAGIIQRFNIGANVYRYDANVDPHPHFICLSCGRVDDMDEYREDLGEFISKAVTSSPYTIQSVNLHFFGFCPQCGKTKKNTDEILRLIDALETADEYKVATPANWRPGDEVIVPPPVTQEMAEERLEEGLNWKDWYFCKKKL